MEDKAELKRERGMCRVFKRGLLKATKRCFCLHIIRDGELVADALNEHILPARELTW